MWRPLGFGGSARHVYGLWYYRVRYLGEGQVACPGIIITNPEIQAGYQRHELIDTERQIYHY